MKLHTRLYIVPAAESIRREIGCSPTMPKETPLTHMYAHIQEPGVRPHFELESTDHPLAQEYHHGITPERVKEIMLRRLPAHGE